MDIKKNLGHNPEIIRLNCCASSELEDLCKYFSDCLRGGQVVQATLGIRYQNSGRQEPYFVGRLKMFGGELWLWQEIKAFHT